MNFQKLQKIISEELQKLLQEQYEEFINPGGGGDPGPPQISKSKGVVTKRPGVSPDDAAIEQVPASHRKKVDFYSKRGYKVVSGLGAAGFRAGDKLFYSGTGGSDIIEITFMRSEDEPGSQFLFMIESGIRGVWDPWQGTWNVEGFEVNDIVNAKVAFGKRQGARKVMVCMYKP